MTISLIVIGVSAVFILAVPVVVTFLSIRGLSSSKLEPGSLEGEDQGAGSEWAGENDFAFVGNYALTVGVADLSMSIWRRSDRPTFFCSYLVQSGGSRQNSYDFVTLFEDDIMLTTNNKSDSQMLPQPPGYYSQSFSRVSLDGQWNRHLEMENYLMDTGGAILVQNDKPFEDCFVNAIQRQVEFVQSQSLWPLRSIYWFYIRRHKRHNLSIQDQHDKGLVILPNELSGFESMSEAAVALETESQEEIGGGAPRQMEILEVSEEQQAQVCEEPQDTLELLGVEETRSSEEILQTEEAQLPGETYILDEPKPLSEMQQSDEPRASEQQDNQEEPESSEEVKAPF